MKNLIIDVLGACCVDLAAIYMCSKLLNKKIDFKNFKIYFYTILFILITILNFRIVNSGVKIIIITIFMGISLMRIFNVSLKEGIVTSFYTQIINLIPEIIFTIIVVTLVEPNININDYPVIFTFAADVFVSIISILIIKTSIAKRLHRMAIKVINKINTKIVLFFMLLVIFIFNAFMITSFYKLNTLYMVLLNYGSVFIIVVIICLLIKKENDYYKISDKYNLTMSSLKEYEDMLDKYRILVHENKNELLTIRNMILNDNKAATKYIDKLVDNKVKDNDNIMKETDKIPAGGLRGLIYSKLLVMKESKLKYNLDISKDVKTADLINLIDDNTMYDICKIIGVLIDNAIDESRKTKERNIYIQMYAEDRSLAISISNNYDGKIEIEKFGKKGYTSKGKNHGYGLALVREIIDRNKKLTNERKISKSIFTQILKIKL